MENDLDRPERSRSRRKSDAHLRDVEEKEMWRRRQRDSERAAEGLMGGTGRDRNLHRQGAVRRHTFTHGAQGRGGDL